MLNKSEIAILTIAVSIGSQNYFKMKQCRHFMQITYSPNNVLITMSCRLRGGCERLRLGIVALSLFMEALFGQSPGVRRYGLGIAVLHIVILDVVHMDLPCRDNSRPHRLLRDPVHKAARDWSASLEGDQGTSCMGGRSVIATRLAQAPTITIRDA